ncbi:MAG: hypothetical protein U0183_24260 [Polyangiaceae bacterium]
MTKLARRILPALLSGGLLGLACSTVDPVDPPAEAGLDADSPDTSVPEPPKDARPDTSEPTTDASQDALADGTIDTDASDGATDAAVDATDDASADAATDAGADASDAGSAPAPLFLAGESGATYTVTAVCAITAVNRTGTAQSCCRSSTYTATTTCESVVREEPDGAGSLRVVVGAMQGCTTTVAGDTCTRSGEIARCDATGLTCPFRRDKGDPSLLVGTYARRTRFKPGGTPDFLDHYWIANCPIGPVGATPNPTCTPPATYAASGSIMTTFARSGAGEFTARRTWGMSVPTECRTPSPTGALTLPNTRFSEAQGAGGTFNAVGYGCTYTLTKK